MGLWHWLTGWPPFPEPDTTEDAPTMPDLEHMQTGEMDTETAVLESILNRLDVNENELIALACHYRAKAAKWEAVARERDVQVDIYQNRVGYLELLVDRLMTCEECAEEAEA